MRVRRHRTVAAAALTSAALLSGCAGGGNRAPAPVAEHRGVVLDVSLGTVSVADVAAAQTAFGLDLLHAVCAERPGENLLLSPTSAAEALGLLQPAAGGETADAVAALLHLPTWSDDLAAALHDHTAALAGLAARDADADADSLRLSNRVWADPSIDPTRAYLDAVATGYDAGLDALDFSGDPAGATARINEAVEHDTAGLIPVLFDEPLSRDTRVVLTNAVHLDATWATAFEDTRPAPFAAPDGEVSADMMTGGAGTATSADGWTRVELPYRDGTLAAVAVLPPAGVDPCSVDGARLDDLAAPAGARTVDVSLPALQLDQKHDLLDTLVGLGLPRDGDFSGFGSADLVVTGAVQKTTLDVDEEGTEAAAATGVLLGESAARVADERVVLDRPFLLLLTDTATRSPLFVAAIQDPTA